MQRNGEYTFLILSDIHFFPDFEEWVTNELGYYEDMSIYGDRNGSSIDLVRFMLKNSKEKFDEEGETPTAIFINGDFVFHGYRLKYMKDLTVDKKWLGL